MIANLNLEALHQAEAKLSHERLTLFRSYLTVLLSKAVLYTEWEQMLHEALEFAQK